MNEDFETDQLSAEGLAHLHSVYSSRKMKKHDPVVILKERILYNRLLQRIPIMFQWEVEKLLRDTNTQID